MLSLLRSFIPVVAGIAGLFRTGIVSCEDVCQPYSIENSYTVLSSESLSSDTITKSQRAQAGKKHKRTSSGSTNDVFGGVGDEALTLLTDIVDGTRMTDLFRTCFVDEMHKIIKAIRDEPKNVILHLEQITMALELLCKSLPPSWIAYGELLRLKLDALTHRVHATMATVDYCKLVYHLSMLVDAYQQYGLLSDEHADDISFTLQISNERVMEAPSILPSMIVDVRRIIEFLDFSRLYEDSRLWDAIETCESDFDSLQTKINLLYP